MITHITNKVTNKNEENVATYSNYHLKKKRNIENSTSFSPIALVISMRSKGVPKIEWKQKELVMTLKYEIQFYGRLQSWSSLSYPT